MKNDDYKLIKENWDKFVEDEPEQLNEIAVIAMGAALLAKFFIALWFGVQNKEKINAISDNIQAQEKTPPKVKVLFNTVDKLLQAAEEAQPDLAAVVQATGSNWNPLAWKANIILSMIKKWTEPAGPPPPEIPPPTVLSRESLRDSRKKNEKK